MPLDPQAQEVLDQLAALGLPPNHTLTPEEARANALARPRAVGPEVAKVEDRTIPSSGSQVPVRIYTPEGTGPFPVLAWFHGGGWVLGNLDSSDATARHLAVEAGCVVVSVDYRLAPEAKFPLPFDDCYAATEWIAQNAASINADPNKIAVGGDSAGGNLAAAVALKARDQGGPSLALQLLVYPVTARDFNTGSYRQNADGYSLTTDAMKWFWDHYLSNDADSANPYAAPAAANDLNGLPPALVITAEFDPLRDEGAMYAEAMAKAGVHVRHLPCPGQIHTSLTAVDMVASGAAARAEMGDAFQQFFDASRPA